MTAEKKKSKRERYSQSSTESKTGTFIPTPVPPPPLTSQFTVPSNNSSIALQASQVLFYYQGPLWIFLGRKRKQRENSSHSYSCRVVLYRMKTQKNRFSCALSLLRFFCFLPRFDFFVPLFQRRK